jgi:hypothetical protein
VANDPWTNAYTVSYDSASAAILVSSKGQNGTAGDADDIIVRQ